MVDWRDRHEALYALLELDDPATSWAAHLAWGVLNQSPDSTLSVGFVPLADELGDLLTRPPGHALYPVTRGALYELSVMPRRGYYEQTRRLTDEEAARMLAGEALDLEPVRVSFVDRLELAGAGA